MPPLRSRPTCAQCGKPHWRFVKCDDATAREQQETRNEERRRSFIITRPREGYREWGNRLAPDTELHGSTFAIKRAPGERHGGYRN